jgi:hypothetical protein
MSVDPLVVQTGAPYYYAGDSPTNGTDPTGLAFGGVCGVFSVSVPLYRGSGAICYATNLHESALVGSLGVSFGLTQPIVNEVSDWITGNASALFTSIGAGFGAFHSTAATAAGMRGHRTTQFYSVGAFGYSVGYTISRSRAGGQSKIVSISASAGVVLNATVGESYNWVYIF